MNNYTFWKRAAIGLAILDVITMAILFSKDPSPSYRPPMHLFASEERLTPIAPPPGEDVDDWYSYYEASCILANEGTEMLELRPYALDFVSNNDQHLVSILDDDREAANARLYSTPCLPSGASMPYTHILQVSTHGDDENSYLPLTLVYDRYSQEIEITYFYPADPE